MCCTSYVLFTGSTDDVRPVDAARSATQRTISQCTRRLHPPRLDLPDQETRPRKHELLLKSPKRARGRPSRTRAPPPWRRQMRGAMIRGAPVRAWVGGAGRKTGCRPHGILQPASRFNSKHPASGNRSGGDRGEGVVGASFPDLPDQAGWTVFHLPSTLRVVAAV